MSEISEGASLAEAWQRATALEKIGMAAIGAAGAVGVLWCVSPTFRGSVKTAVAVGAANSAAKDFRAVWKNAVTDRMVAVVNPSVNH